MMSIKTALIEEEMTSRVTQRQEGERRENDTPRLDLSLLETLKAGHSVVCG